MVLFMLLSLVFDLAYALFLSIEHLGQLSVSFLLLLEDKVELGFTGVQEFADCNRRALMRHRGNCTRERQRHNRLMLVW
jgi:hypothetical protein